MFLFIPGVVYIGARVVPVFVYSGLPGTNAFVYCVCVCCPPLSGWLRFSPAAHPESQQKRGGSREPQGGTAALVC